MKTSGDRRWSRMDRRRICTLLQSQQVSQMITQGISKVGMALKDVLNRQVPGLYRPTSVLIGYLLPWAEAWSSGEWLFDQGQFPKRNLAEICHPATLPAVVGISIWVLSGLGGRMGFVRHITGIHYRWLKGTIVSNLQWGSISIPNTNVLETERIKSQHENKLTALNGSCKNYGDFSWWEKNKSKEKTSR